MTRLLSRYRSLILGVGVVISLSAWSFITDSGGWVVRAESQDADPKIPVPLTVPPPLKSPPRNLLIPVVNCVAPDPVDGSSLIARFGYESTYNGTVIVSSNATNFFYEDAAFVPYAGQPQQFSAGIHENAFAYRYANTSSVEWDLLGVKVVPVLGITPFCGTGPQGPKGERGSPGDFVVGPRGYNGTDGAAGANGTNGKDGLGFTFRGEWNGTVMYTLNDVVVYGESTWLYLLNASDWTGVPATKEPGFDATKAPTATPEPGTDPTAWALLAAAGARGADGAPGANGTDGKEGPPGPRGINGTDGNEGKEGPSGPRGANGTDGKEGPPGPRGANGTDGKEGKEGPSGPRGTNGTDGKEGKEGPPGHNGSNGTQGPPGPKGDPGPGWPIGAIIELVQSATPPDGFVLIGTYVRELRPPVATSGNGNGNNGNNGQIRLTVYVYQKR